MPDKELLQCYNRGCGQKYDPDDNKPDSCSYHPGAPFFHDAYKGWSCCQKKSIDFTTFLALPPCTRGYHSNVKPAEPQVSKEKLAAGEKPVKETVKPLDRTPKPRPPPDEPMIEVPCRILDHYKEELSKTTKGGPDPTGNVTDVAQSKNCIHPGCGVSQEKANSVCVYHPGQPVFHEGMKYWSCCERKTTDFSAFMEQPGCTRGEHCWKREEQASNADQTPVKCRVEMYQIGRDCVANIFAKKIVPDTCQVLCNQIKMSVSFTFSGGRYSEEFDLWGVIVPAECSAVISATKIEIKLRKDDSSIPWRALTI